MTHGANVLTAVKAKRDLLLPLWIPAVVLLIAVVLLNGCDVEDSRQAISPPTQGISGDQVLVGSSLALTGHAAYLGIQTLHGALSYIKHVNANGGVHGRQIRLIALDDGYDPPRCVHNTQRLIVDEQVFALFCYVGTPTTVKIIPLIGEAKIPLLGMFTGANALREPLHRYLINVRASYYQEIGAAVEHLVKNLKRHRIAVFYQYDAYGFDGLRGTELALKKFGLVPVATGTYIRGTLNIEEGLARIISSEAEAVVMIGTYDPCAKFIKLSKRKQFDPVFYTVSFVGAEELARRLGPDGEGVIATQVVPPPELPAVANRLWGTQEYIRLLQTYYPQDKPNFVSLEGYINARVLVEGLRRAGPNLDREQFIDSIEQIRNYDLGIANTLSFSPADHQGLERVYFTAIRQGRFRLIENLGLPGNRLGQR
jgi:ABC-type branched-subunit amino acid transport system substrate-binding protein